MIEFIQRKEELMAKLNRGEFDPEEWLAFIRDTTEAGMFAMANDMRYRYDYYSKRMNNEIHQ